MLWNVVVRKSDLSMIGFLEHFLISGRFYDVWRYIVGIGESKSYPYVQIKFSSRQAFLYSLVVCFGCFSTYRQRTSAGAVSVAGDC